MAQVEIKQEEIFEYTIRDAGFAVALEKAVKESGKKYYKATYAQPSKEVRYFKLDKTNANPVKNNDGYIEITNEQAYKDCGYIVEYVTKQAVEAENRPLSADNQLVGQIDQQDKSEPAVASVASSVKVLTQLTNKDLDNQVLADGPMKFGDEQVANGETAKWKHIAEDYDKIIEQQKAEFDELIAYHNMVMSKLATIVNMDTEVENATSGDSIYDAMVVAEIEKQLARIAELEQGLTSINTCMDVQVEQEIKRVAEEYAENIRNTDLLVNLLSAKGYEVKLKKVFKSE